MKSRHHLIWLALMLMIIWVILRVALAITSLALHVLWIGAIIAALIWLMRQLSSKGSEQS
jgi:hypothetical protein